MPSCLASFYIIYHFELTRHYHAPAPLLFRMLCTYIYGYLYLENSHVMKNSRCTSSSRSSRRCKRAARSCRSQASRPCFPVAPRRPSVAHGIKCVSRPRGSPRQMELTLPTAPMAAVTAMPPSPLPLAPRSASAVPLVVSLFFRYSHLCLSTLVAPILTHSCVAPGGRKRAVKAAALVDEDTNEDDGTLSELPTLPCPQPVLAIFYFIMFSPTDSIRTFHVMPHLRCLRYLIRICFRVMVPTT